MPYSSTVFDPLTTQLLAYLSPQRCLDIGAGAGKYGVMLREVVPDAYTVAIEIESDYVHRFQLARVYNEVRCCDVMDILKADIDTAYNLVIIGDTIEHLRKSAGVDLLHFLAYRTNFLLVLYPEQYLQNSVYGYFSEAHISSWEEPDFHWLKHSVIARNGSQRLVVLQGFLSSEQDIDEINRIIAQYGY